MPSNKNLIESIEKVATEKGVDIPNTVGLSNDNLNETLKYLRALEAKPAESTEESENLTSGDNKPDNQNAEKDKRAQEKAAVKAKTEAIPPYRVADGKSITCRKGVLDEGKEIKAEYLPGGQESLNTLVDRGFVTKK